LTAGETVVGRLHVVTWQSTILSRERFEWQAAPRSSTEDSGFMLMREFRISHHKETKRPMLNFSDYASQSSSGVTVQPLMTRMMFERAALSPLDYTPSPDFKSESLKLAPDPGLYSATYGPHGIEILRLTWETSSSCDCAVRHRALPHHPAAGIDARLPHMHAMKLIGDPNVPALKLSFVFDLGKFHPGRYQSELDDPMLEQGLVQAPRLILVFRNGTLEGELDLRARPVIATFFGARGTINRRPGAWNPEHVLTSVVVYEKDNDDVTRGKLPAFSVLYHDEDMLWRHLTDFYHFRCPENFQGGA
jgi:hypothetical protein